MRKTIRGIFTVGVALLAVSGEGTLRAQTAPAGMTIQKNVLVGTKHCDVVTWTVYSGRPRR